MEARERDVSRMASEVMDAAQEVDGPARDVTRVELDVGWRYPRVESTAGTMGAGVQCVTSRASDVARRGHHVGQCATGMRGNGSRGVRHRFTVVAARCGVSGKCPCVRLRSHNVQARIHQVAKRSIRCQVHASRGKFGGEECKCEPATGNSDTRRCLPGEGRTMCGLFICKAEPTDSLLRPGTGHLRERREDIAESGRIATGAQLLVTREAWQGGRGSVFRRGARCNA